MQYWKVLNFKIDFQDLKKVSNLAKIYIRYWKSMEILNGKEIWSIWTVFYWRQSTSLFMQMCKVEFHEKMKRSNGIELFKFSIEKVLKKYGKWFFLNVWEPWWNNRTTGWKKVVLNKINKSLLSWVNNVCSTSMVTILAADVARTNLCYHS